jgi:hypothetical protein
MLTSAWHQLYLQPGRSFVSVLAWFELACAVLCYAAPERRVSGLDDLPARLGHKLLCCDRPAGERISIFPSVLV